MAQEVMVRWQGMRKLYGSLFAPLLARYALTQTEADVLMFLANNPEYDTAHDMVEHRHLAKSHVSASVDALAERGLLERFYRDGNRKTIHLRLTPQARPITEEGARLQNRFGALMIAGFSEEEVLQMEALMRRMQQNIEAALAAEKAGGNAENTGITGSAGPEALERAEKLVARLRAGDTAEVGGILQ
ncbi:MAG: MarR family transcriptional regulator [Subdoligranulum sp.]|nr:MarR family transcriptional regulator [Subdoligranulum sp.]